MALGLDIDPDLDVDVDMELETEHAFDSEFRSHPGLDSDDHQTAYIFAPSEEPGDTVRRPTKKRKIAKPTTAIQSQTDSALPFEALLNGTESLQAVNLRQELFTRCWSQTESRINSVLDEANQGTLAEVVTFVESSSHNKQIGMLPTGFIVTGPNIASQELLFKQLSTRLKLDTNGPAVLLRSGDTSNLKTALKQIIRDATNQKRTFNSDEGDHVEQHGRKTLNYDLELLHRFVKAHRCRSVVVVFQDSEAFDNDLLADLIKLFSSWSDRVPFVLLYGIATSVALFHERLARSASRLLSGAQFDVENTNVVLERIFRKTVTGVQASLRLGGTLVTSLMARQNHHVQSVQSFTTALKYAYMCYFYGNALSILHDASQSIPFLASEHLEAIRMLPSFRMLVETNLKSRPAFVRGLLDDDAVLKQTIKASLARGKEEAVKILRAMHILTSVSPENPHPIELYLAGFNGNLNTSALAERVLDSIKRMDPVEVLSFLKSAQDAIRTGCPENDLCGWADDASEFLRDLAVMAEEVALLAQISTKSNNPVRSSYAIHSKGLRTTIIAQRVQLSYEQSKLSKEDQAFTALVDRLSTLLANLLACPKPQNIFLNEIWLYDSDSPYECVFTPRPRFSVERALTSPHDYLDCACCKPDEGLSATQPATASLYQMYLQAGSLINIADLWSAFLDNQNQNSEEDFDEREAVAQFYQGLVDLKLLGMVKHSKKKVDHLAKILWEGL